MSIVKLLIEYHKMIPHPEGGHYVEVFKNKDVSHIYFLLEGHEHSHWHRITKNETVHFYSGDPLEIYTSKDGEEFETNQIGSNNNFIYSIEKNTWFAMKSKGKYSLIGCTVAPAFEFEDLELAPKDWKPSKFNLSLK
ncbi:cupin domain-containing protein [Candidatus Pelagibacter communis]|uniref:cupin domain-containing protein n=1 Tax=Pelagibacter ubique TaxID=198252 RepID=UPI000A95C32A|nr:cupin domain-containing protein [Candidatus Pelagibacter ubique]